MDRRTSPGFIDILFILLQILILLPHLTAEDTFINPGTISVEVTWPNQQIDVDLWVKAPGDTPVGYSNLSGEFFNLLRDDLGNRRDGANFEHAFTRGAPNGGYIANVHMFSNAAGLWPVPVDMKIFYKPSSGKRQKIYEGSVMLRSRGQEMTVVRWTMQDGRFVEGSIHMTQERIRSSNSRRGR